MIESMTDTKLTRPDDDNVVFSAVLEPHRSASVRNLNVAVLIFALGSFPFCILFWALGAWPVIGFVGIDVLLLIAALRFHHRAGRAYETIHLTENALTIERVNHWGRSRTWSFTPYWLQVIVEDVDAYRNRLEIRNREQTLAVGSFLSTQEKIDLAIALKHSLENLHSPTYAPS